MLGKACGFPAGMRRQGGIFVKFNIIVPLATRKMPHRVILGALRYLQRALSAEVPGGESGSMTIFSPRKTAREPSPDRLRTQDDGTALTDESTAQMSEP